MFCLYLAFLKKFGELDLFTIYIHILSIDPDEKDKLPVEHGQMQIH